MLFNDGNYVIYVIVHRHTKDGEWVQSNLDHFGHGEHTSDKKNFSMSASGACWQSTGIHDTFDLPHARKVMKRLAKKHRSEWFGVQACVIRQKRKIVEEAA